MYVLDASDSVIQLRFLPDGRGLVACLASPDRVVRFDLLALRGGGRVRLPLPRLDFQSWYDSGYGSAVAVHPSGDWCYVAWGGRLFSFHTADATPRPVPESVKAHQVALAPTGDRLVAAQSTWNSPGKQLSALAVDAAGDALVWQQLPPPSRRAFRLAGFLPDGERFVTVDEVVRIRSFATGDEQAAGRHRPAGTEQAQVSPDGRHVAMVGYSSMYVFDLEALGKPRRIPSSSGNRGNFVSFAFHPDGRTLAVIHGGPTLLKVYDVATLRLTHTYRWKLGPLGCVAFSADGMLGAVGSRDGRILVWDVDR